MDEQNNDINKMDANLKKQNGDTIAKSIMKDKLESLEDLFNGGEINVAKHTIRVYTNTFRNALQEVASGELEIQQFRVAWPMLKQLTEQLTQKLSLAENEGLVVQIIRFLEAMVLALLLCDVSRYPDVEADIAPLVDGALNALLTLVTMPYVGGTACLVGIRALITLACYKQELAARVTDIVEGHISSPPPTLFDHNVRSLRKILCKNLFRLLRRAGTDEARARLIEMMVSVGVPRRMMSQWAPPPESLLAVRKRRTPPLLTADEITGHPPSKKLKLDTENSEFVIVADLSNIDQNRLTPSITLIEEMVRENRTLDSLKVENSNEVKSEISVDSNKQTPCNTNLESNSKLGDKLPNTPKQFLEWCNNRESQMYRFLDHPSVVKLVLSAIKDVPDEADPEKIAKLVDVGGNVETMRQMLAGYFARPPSPLVPPALVTTHIIKQTSHSDSDFWNVLSAGHYDRQDDVDMRSSENVKESFWNSLDTKCPEDPRLKRFTDTDNQPLNLVNLVTPNQPINLLRRSSPNDDPSLMVNIVNQSLSVNQGNIEQTRLTDQHKMQTLSQDRDWRGDQDFRSSGSNSINSVARQQAVGRNQPFMMEQTYASNTNSSMMSNQNHYLPNHPFGGNPMMQNGSQFAFNPYLMQQQMMFNSQYGNPMTNSPSPDLAIMMQYMPGLFPYSRPMHL